MLAVVEHDQRPLRSQQLENRTLQRETRARPHRQRRRDQLHQRFGVGHGGEFAQPRAIGKTLQQLGRQLNRDTRLAHTSSPGDGDHPRLAQHLAQFGELVAATHERRHLHRQVARKGSQRLQRSERPLETGRTHLKDPLGTRQVTQRVLAEVDQFDGARQRVAHQVSRRLRTQDLPAVRHRFETRGPIHRRAEIIAVTQLRHTRMNPDSHPQRFAHLPRLRADHKLRINRGADRTVRGREHRVHPVAASLHHLAAVRRDRVPQDRVVAGERGAHRIGLLIPQTRRHLEIGEQEGHRPRWQLHHHHPSPVRPRQPSKPGK